MNQGMEVRRLEKVTSPLFELRKLREHTRGCKRRDVNIWIGMLGSSTGRRGDHHLWRKQHEKVDGNRKCVLPYWDIGMRNKLL